MSASLVAGVVIAKATELVTVAIAAAQPWVPVVQCAVAVTGVVDELRDRREARDQTPSGRDPA